MDEVQKKEVVLVSRKPLWKPNGYRGKHRLSLCVIRMEVSSY